MIFTKEIAFSFQEIPAGLFFRLEGFPLACSGETGIMRLLGMTDDPKSGIRALDPINTRGGKIRTKGQHRGED